jgi:hypothetical protein
MSLVLSFYSTRFLQNRQQLKALAGAVLTDQAFLAASPPPVVCFVPENR